MYVVGGPPLQEAVLQLLLGVARGMAYLHNHNVCHGDLKAANVLLTSVAEGGAAPLAVSTSASNTATTSTNITGTTGSAINVSMACCYVTSSGPHALDRGTRFVPKVADFGLSRCAGGSWWGWLHCTAGMSHCCRPVASWYLSSSASMQLHDVEVVFVGMMSAAPPHHTTPGARMVSALTGPAVC